MACTARFERENAVPSGRKELADGKMGSAGASGDRLGLTDGVSKLDEPQQESPWEPGGSI